jgi:3-deoxy-D-manno-octulosonic-acid transferase
MKMTFKMFLYEGLWIFLSFLIRIAGQFSPKLQDHWHSRLKAEGVIAEWARLRSRYPKSYLFVCSSAGEYEQAKPLLTRLQKRGDAALFILFFSPSGIKFATSQKETIPFALVASDRPSYWREVCAQLRPDALIFVRYELWPGLVHMGKLFAPLYLIDGVEANHLRKKRVARALRSSLLEPMKKIFVVASEDQDFYVSVLHAAPEKVTITGDTKYDRVLERMEERQEALDKLKSSLNGFLEGRRIIVLGSAWQRDLQEFMIVYRQLLELDSKIALIVAPHDLSESNISTMQKMLENVRTCRVSTEGYNRATAEHAVLLVDVLGDLPELYGCAHLAWVGGALHYRVHNVLEPACRGLYLCFGPMHETSQEAKGLVKQGLARVIHNGHEFYQWYKNLSWKTHPPHQAMWQAVVEQKGASDRIMNEISASGHK